jgi:hypothetical protein
MAELGDELVHGLVLLTEQVLVANPTATPAEHKLQIFPQTYKWTFRILATFLNERGHEWTMTEPIRLRTTGKFGAHYVGVCGRSGVPDRQNVRIQLWPHEAKGKFMIVVDADVTWFGSDSTAHRTDILTATDTHGRTFARPKEKSFIQSSWSRQPFAELRPSSQALLESESVLLTEPSCRSRTFGLFVSQCLSVHLPHDWETNFLYDLAEALSPPPRPGSVPNLGELASTYTGICC